LVSVFGELHPLLCEHRGEYPVVVPVLVCHDKVVVECGAEQVAEAKTWLEEAMIEGMEAVLNGTHKVDVPVEVEARIARSWSEGGSSLPPNGVGMGVGTPHNTVRPHGNGRGE
jgi:hypothetical protein